MDDFSSPEEMALAASVSGFIVSDGSEDTVSSRCTSAEGKAVHPVLSKFQPNLPLCTPPSGVRFLWYSHWRQSSKQPVSCSLGFPPLYDSRFAHIGEHFHCGRIVMVKEQTLPSSRVRMASISASLREKSNTSRFCSIRSL